MKAEINKKLDEIDDVIIKDNHPTIDELMQIRKVIWEGLLLCNKLYKKSGSVEKAIKLYYETRMNIDYDTKRIKTIRSFG